MKKRILSLTLTFTLLLSVLPLGAFNLTASATSENGFAYSVVNNEATINDYTGSVTNLTIPDTLAGYKVTSIGYSAFSYCTSLQSITIPNSVTSIGCSAFYYCTALQSITVAENNQNYSSADGVLFNKDKTTLICYPEGKQGAAYTIANSVTSIGDSAFYNCTALQSIEIPNSVTSIDDRAFFNCSLLESIEIPNSVIYISFCAFQACSSLESIEIPNNVMSIGNGAFDRCSSLKSIIIPDSVTDIGERAFSYCSSLTNVTIPNSVTDIGERAFSYCSSLTSVTIPNSVTTIDSDAFWGCYSLVDVYYAGTETEWNNVSIGNFNGYLLNANIHFHKNNYYKWVVDTPASCYQAGVQHEECSVCHTKRNEDTPIAATGHNFNHNNWVVDTPATCIGDGVKHKECATAGCTAKDAENTPIAATGHNLVPVVDVQPSCVAGSQHLACTKCAHTDSWGTVIPSVNAHTSDNGKVTKKATTKADGKKVYSCTGCGAVLKTETLQKTVTAKSVKSTKKATVKITWKKDSKVKGYEIVYATNKKFTKGKKTITIKSNKTTSKTIKKLKAKKTYYVKIRSYKTVKGKKIYGAYSKVKKVKVK